jgi:hypothetical protein
MRELMVSVLAVGLAGTLWAQPRRTYGSRSGFGNVVFPGTGSAPPLQHRFSISDPSFAQRLSATISGFPPYTGAPARPFGLRRTMMPMAPLGFPVLVGGYYQTPVYEPAPPVVYYPPAQPAPQVVINQYFSTETARPAAEEPNLRIHDVPARTPAQPAEVPFSFLIATRDRSVFSAAAYWVEGETFHYVTPRGKHEQLPLTQLDRELSEKLNENRQIQFRLPPAK